MRKRKKEKIVGKKKQRKRSGKKWLGINVLKLGKRRSKEMKKIMGIKSVFIFGENIQKIGGNVSARRVKSQKKEELNKKIGR